MAENIISFKASGNISPSRFVTLSGAYQVAQVSAPTQPILGVSQEGTKYAPLQDLAPNAYAAEAGNPVDVYVTGSVCLVEAGAAVAAGVWLGADSQGRAIAATTAAHVGGISLDAASAAGEKIRIFVQPYKYPG